MSKPLSDDLVSVTFAMKPDPPGEDPWPYPPGLADLSAARDRVVEAAKEHYRVTAMSHPDCSCPLCDAVRALLALEAGEPKEGA